MLAHFPDQPAIRNALEPLLAIGLDYLRLGQPLRTLALEPIPILSRNREHNIELLIYDSMNARSNTTLDEAIRKALALGGGSLIIMTESPNTSQTTERVLCQHLYCHSCGQSFLPLDPRLFSFNSAYGACPVCGGTGIIPGQKRKNPGKDDQKYSVCPECKGDRLCSQARSVLFRGLSIGELVRLNIREFYQKWRRIEPRDSLEARVLAPISREISSRVDLLIQLGLDYLDLNRSGDTLSGGEMQCLRLAAQLGSNLKGICYILDEPAIGLHPADNERLLNALKTLKERGNTWDTLPWANPVQAFLEVKHSV